MDKNPNISIKLVNKGDISIDNELDPCNTPIGSSRYQFGTIGTNSSTSSTDFDEYFRNPSSILSLQPWIFKREKQNPNFTEKAETSTNYKSSLRTKRGQNRNLIKPISIENSLIPQLFNEDFKFEEFVYGESKTRPFVVTDGIRVLSKNSVFENSSKDSDFLRGNEINEVKKGKRKSLDLGENGNLRSTKHLNSQAHSPSYPAGESSTNNNNKNNNDNNNDKNNNGKMFILSMGICIGVLSSILSNKKEFEKLNDKLKSSQNLIQDLQEELEMKDSLTVKELLPLEEEPKEPSRSFLQEDNNQSMSKIEAELEAELEMLELNTNWRPPVFHEEIIEEPMGEIIKDNLKAETLNYKKDDYYDDNDDYYHNNNKNNHNDDISDENHCTGPVSPRQLSIKLHELIQYRLEERVKELETQLEKSQRQIQLLETDFSERTLSNSDLDSGPLINNNNNDNNSDEPFCLNLSGDALSAYREAFVEFEKEKDDGNNDKNDINIDINIGDYDYDFGNYDENEESDDDCDEIIKKIVEKNREGSPVIRHAQMMLLSLDDLN